MLGGFGRRVGATKPVWLQMGRPARCMLISLAPYVPSKMGLCPETPYRDFAARPEHLDRAQGHPREVEGDLNCALQQPIQPGRIPTAPRELPQLPSLLYTASLLFVVHVVVPCRRDRFSCGLDVPGSFGKQIEAGQARVAPGAPACRCTW